jgi:hypothetical protein
MNAATTNPVPETTIFLTESTGQDTRRVLKNPPAGRCTRGNLGQHNTRLCDCPQHSSCFNTLLQVEVIEYPVDGTGVRHHVEVERGNTGFE